MSKSKRYTKAPPDVVKELQDSKAAEDVLPSPDTIAKMLQDQQRVPVTMKLRKTTLDRYKRFAARKGIKYQTFVSTLLDSYAERL